jgi:hypothetical protein
MDSKSKLLYDSKFVYFEWDDCLNGVKGFVNDSCPDLNSNMLIIG